MSFKTRPVAQEEAWLFPWTPSLSSQQQQEGPARCSPRTSYLQTVFKTLHLWWQAPGKTPPPELVSFGRRKQEAPLFLQGNPDSWCVPWLQRRLVSVAYQSGVVANEHDTAGAALPTGPELLARSAQLQSSRKTLEGQDLGEEVLRASILFNLLLG